MSEWEYKTLTFEYIHEEIKEKAEKSFPMPTLAGDYYSFTGHETQRRNTINSKKSWIEHETPKRIQEEIKRLISQTKSYPGETDFIGGWELDSEKDGKYTFKKKLTKSE